MLFSSSITTNKGFKSFYQSPPPLLISWDWVYFSSHLFVMCMPKVYWLFGRGGLWDIPWRTVASIQIPDVKSLLEIFCFAPWNMFLKLSHKFGTSLEDKRKLQYTLSKIDYKKNQNSTISGVGGWERRGRSSARLSPACFLLRHHPWA